MDQIGVNPLQDGPQRVPPPSSLGGGRRRGSAANPTSRAGAGHQAQLSQSSRRHSSPHPNDLMQAMDHDLNAASSAGPGYNLMSSSDPVQATDGDLYVSPKATRTRMDQIRSLKELGFSTGLARALAVNKDAFLYRLWVVDNSGSMMIGDGHRIVQTADRQIKAQAVTRFEELQDAVVYHSQIAAILQSPSIFTLLNDPGVNVGSQQFSIAVDKRADPQDEVRQARTLMQRAKPSGVTPLTPHIHKIQASIQKLAPKLRREGKRVAIILATDGLPTNAEGYDGEEIRQEFVHSLRGLEGLPVWLVIRLCTDEDEVTEFYNDLDGKLELSLEVLDDFLGEAKEVHRVNKWLNYALPLHRCRELGYQDRLFDLLDERAFTKGELRDFCSLLFGTDVEQIPDPATDWKGFLKYVQGSLELEEQHWDPIRKKQAPWIHLKVLHKIYGKGGCSIM